MWGTSATAKASSNSSPTVSATPSTVTEPFSTQYRSTSDGASTTTRRPALGLDRLDPADGVHVTLDVVPAERLAGAQSRLDVDLGAEGKRSQGRHPQCFRHCLEGDLGPSTDSAVRHTPLTATESPTWTRGAVSGASTMRTPSVPPSTAATLPTSFTMPVNTTQG